MLESQFPYQNRFHGHTWLKRTKQIFAFWVVVFLLGFTAVYINSGRYVAKNVYLQNELAEGLNRQQVMEIVNGQIAVLKGREIRIADENIEYLLSSDDLGIRFDAEATVNALFAAGRSLWLKAQLLSFDENNAKEKRIIQPVVEVDPNHVRQVVQAELAKGERPVRNAQLAWSKDAGWQVTNAVFGRQVADGEVERIAQSIVKGVYDLNNKLAYFHAKYERVEPTVFRDELDEMLRQVSEFSQKQVHVKINRVTEVIDVPAESDQWFTFDYKNKAILANGEKIASYAAEFTGRYNVEPSEVIVREVQEFESEYTEGTYKKAIMEGDFVFGRNIHSEKLASDLTAALLNLTERKVEVSFERIPTKIVSRVPGFEFPELISLGESSYEYGNKPNRVHNIKRALELEDLTVIEPGEVFSYNKVLGWVTYAKGYVDGEVIFGNSLANVAGGGVCQTSTTMFRAAVNAGLPIVERRNHSWDVHYYQDWHGVDATVYPPGKVDLMFQNDTPGPILVHSYTDDENEMAYFELYGTSDGRQVATETVVNYRIGAGRKIITNWDVTYANGIVDKREIVSVYKK